MKKQLSILAISASLLVSACGVKGPLYLPAEQPQQQSQQQQPQTK